MYNNFLCILKDSGSESERSTVDAIDKVVIIQVNLPVPHITFICLTSLSEPGSHRIFLLVSIMRVIQDC